MAWADRQLAAGAVYGAQGAMIEDDRLAGLADLADIACGGRHPVQQVHKQRGIERHGHLRAACPVAFAVQFGRDGERGECVPRGLRTDHRCEQAGERLLVVGGS